MSKAVQPFEPVGAWEVPHYSYVHAARDFRRRIKADVDRLNALVPDGTDPIDFDWRRHKARFQFLRELSLAGQFFAFAAIEGFLNLYGMARFGTEYHKSAVERISPPERKLAVILGVAEGKLLDDADEIVTLTRSMAARRNALVHPKAKPQDVVALGRGRPINLLTDIDREIADMDRFFELFKTYHTKGFPVESDLGNWEDEPL